MRIGNRNGWATQHPIQLLSAVWLEAWLWIAARSTNHFPSLVSGNAQHRDCRSPDLDPSSTLLLIEPLNNWRRHREDEGWDEQVRFWDVDYMSSAPSFEGWLELKDRALQHRIAEEHRLCVARPQGWLLAEGWKRGGTISMYAVPGPTNTLAFVGP